MTDPISRASETMARCTAALIRPQPRGRRPAPMVDWIALWDGYAWPGIIIVAQIVAILVPLLLRGRLSDLCRAQGDRRHAAAQGPNVVGPFGLLQPIADAVKLLFKETILPAGANKVVFVAAPMLTFILALIGWAVIPSTRAGCWPTSTSASSTSSRFPRSAFTA